jgi:hypothetical protein
MFGILAVAFVGCVITAIARAFGDTTAADKAVGGIAKFNTEYDQRFSPEA